MTPNAGGRYCSSCSKTVTDFSAMTDESIQHYFTQHRFEPGCGRFKKEQLHRIVIDLPHNLFELSMPFWKKFLAAMLLIFSASVFPFETTIAGKTAASFEYYQDDPNAVNQDKKPRILKKKRHRRQRLTFIIPSSPVDTVICVMGGMGINQLPDIPLIIEPVNDSSSHSAIYATKNVDSPTPEDKQPKPSPPVSTEFILPSLLLKKSKNDNTSMD